MRTQRLIVGICVITLASGVSMASASGARAAFGDLFGIAPVNQDGGQTVLVFPDDRAAWAGACDTGAAPGFDVPIPGGIGARSDTVWSPAPTPPSGFATGEQMPLDAPASPDHCIDWGRLAPAGNPDYLDLWREPGDHDPSWGPAGGGLPSWRLAPVTQAGAHPDGTATMWFRRDTTDASCFPPPPSEPKLDCGAPDGSVDNISVDLPAGFVGDPRAVPKCTSEQFAVKPVQCPPETQVGIVRLYLVASIGGNYPGANEETLPVYNLEPRQGKVAEFGVANLSVENAATVRITAKARTNGDFGVTTFVSQIPASLPLISQSITLWGVPWDPAHDLWRPPTGWSNTTGPAPSTAEIPVTGVPAADQVHYDRAWGPIKPFISNPTECSGQALSTRLSTDSYENPGAFTAEGDVDLLDLDWDSYDSPADPVTGCDKLPFDPLIDPQPTSPLADSPTGLSVDLSIPQNDDLPFPVPPLGATQGQIAQYATDALAHWRSDDGLATSQLDRAVVTLPKGVSVNPSGAAGLKACSDDQIGVTDATTSPMLFNNADPFDGQGPFECPLESKIGTVSIQTPLLEQPLTGQVVLGEPRSTDPESGDMFRLFIVVRDVERGLIAKIAGSSIADEQTGQLTATFDKNPRVPFEEMQLEFKGGPRGLLATPPRCANHPWAALFTPWTAAHGAGGTAVPNTGAFVTNQRCDRPFAPTLDAADISNRRGAGSGTFTFQLSRADGHQWLDGLSTEVPQGLVAAVKHVPLCTNPQANANACPLSSKIGSVDAAAGAGSPFVLERKGSVYLTEGYKGAPYGLAVSVPVEAGPFRGKLALEPIVVRQALRVDPDDASVTAVSDPFPEIHHGIPLRVRQVMVKIDRPGFMRNPTDCSAKQTKANLTSTDGATASPTRLFQAAGCKALPFRPKLAMKLVGRRQTTFGKHPGIRATLTQPAGQANIKATTVRLPRSLALDIDRAQSESLCSWEESLKADPKCPTSSVIGSARAFSPLLKRPLEGPVYFAKRKRINEFGRAIPTFPSLVLALRGEIALNVRANTDVKPGKLISTFPAVPDAPVSRFELDLKGGKRGILLVTKSPSGKKLNICGRQVAEVDMDAHSGRRHDFDVRMKTPCKKPPKLKKRRDKRR